MKYETILFAIFLVCSSAAPQQKEEIAIISQNSDSSPDGSYTYNFETANGIKADETGTLKKASGPDTSDVIISQGSYSYTAPDGQVISLQYVADDVGGFQPRGDHLPTPPPIPPAIQKALDFLASLPPQNK